MKIGYIYSLSDPRNGEIRYVGQSVEPKRRLSNHISTSKCKDVKYDHVHSWIKKLLKEGVKPIMNIIHDGIELMELDEMEMYYIYQFKEIYGYKLTNILSGGQNGFVYNQDQIERMRIISTKQRNIYGINVMTRLVIKYSSTVDANHKLGFLGKDDYGHIMECCDGKRKTMKGYIFVREEDFIKLGVDFIMKSRVNSQYKPILKYNTNGDFVEEFISRSAAAASVIGTPIYISNCCNKLSKYISYKGYQWRWKESDNFPHKISPMNKKLEARPVMQTSLIGKEIGKYNSIQEASNLTGVGYDSIQNTCANRQMTGGGFKWNFL